jgi:hypothetical protein
MAEWIRGANSMANSDLNNFAHKLLVKLFIIPTLCDISLL